MFFSEFLINSNEFLLYDEDNNLINDNNLITELAQMPTAIPQKSIPPQQMQQQVPNFSDPNMMNQQQPLSPSSEFETIKQFILYSRFKEIRQHLQDLNIKIRNIDIESMIEFLDIILLFYNSFSYPDLTSFMDTITSSIEEKLKIKLPKRIFSDPELDSNIDPNLDMNPSQY